MPTVSRGRISTKCPVCGGRVYPLSRPEDAVSTEDDEGKIQYWHSVCYDTALEES